MAKYIITYEVELEVPEGKSGELEAYYWHDTILRDPERTLPEHVYWVRTMPKVELEETE
jgi:hypothetical protein